MDVLIPLAESSSNNFLELKLALRSLAKCSDVGTIYIITTGKIPWIRDVKIVPIDDPIVNNKDKNLIRKVELTLQQFPEITDFVLWSDDYIVTKPISLNDLPDVYNNRTIETLTNISNRTKWQNRLLWTLTTLKMMNKDLGCNWDSHTPLKLNREKVLDGLDHVMYMSNGANFTLCTLLAALCDKTREHGVLQDFVKCTCESPDFVLNLDKLLVGYNDKAFNNGLKELLLRQFPDKSKYELETVDVNSALCILASNLTDLDTFKRIINGVNKHIVVFTCDATTKTTLLNSGINTIDVSDLSISNTFLLAKLISEYAILYDGLFTYPNTYINECLKDTIENVCLIYEPSKHKGIVNNILLTIKNIHSIQETDLFTAIERIADTVTPIIVIRENEV